MKKAQYAMCFLHMRIYNIATLQWEKAMDVTSAYARHLKATHCDECARKETRNEQPRKK